MKKFLSLLLAAVMVFGLISVVSADVIPNKGKDDTISGMAADATNVQYLSDLYNTDKMVYQQNNKVTLDKNYHGYLYVFAEGQRRVLKAGGTGVDANGYRTLENGVTYHKDEIALGYNGTQFAKGLGVHPSAPGDADRYIVYDVSKLNVNRFYAVVGGTGEKITIPGEKNHYLEFELLGSKSATYDANSFETLAKAENIRSYLCAEFNVDITGYNFIKLVVRATGVNNTSCGGAWGGACVYSSATPVGPSLGVAAQPDAYTPSENGFYNGIPTEFEGNSAYLSEFPIVESSNNSNKPSSVDAPYGAADEVITIGALSTPFWSGIGMHPKSGGVDQSWTIFDVSELNADRFYSVVGITNANGKNGAGSGVVFGVYGDYGDGNYVLLAQSEHITMTKSGELDVDITGVKLLKLVVIPGGTSNASSGCAWADASVYSTTGELNVPTEPETEPVTRPTSTRPTTKPTTPSTTEPESAEFPVGLVIGIAAAVVVAIVAVVVIIVIKKKKPEAPAE